MPEASWHEWRRLEAAVNLAFSRHDVWVVCAYDRRTLAEEMVDDLYATHQATGCGGEHRHNDRYQDPVEFVSERMDAPPDPVEASPPSAELLDPSPSTARAAVGAFAIHSKLPPQEVENMVLATPEVVSNAGLHGRPPVILRLWVLPGRLTVTVTDTGTGPTNPFLGLLPPDHPHGSGLGLWISHQLVDMTHRRHRDGYTVRLTAGGASPSAEEPALRAWTRRAGRDAPLSADPAAPGSRRTHPPSRPSATPVRRRRTGPRPRSRPSSGACPAGTGSTGLRCRCSAGP